MNFNHPYNREDFERFVQNFLPDDFIPASQEMDYQASFSKKITKLGKCATLDLEVFEVAHTSTHDARVGLSRESFKMLQHYSYCNRALIAFVPMDESGQWRFSLLQIELEQQDHSARISKNYSNPRRYSFLLGEDKKIKTPQQFLIEKGKITNWEDLQKRFSVEVLTKEFYTELFEWYKWALTDEMKVTFPNDTSTDEDDRNIEEHLIRLITRLMFVWFIKQKKLIPEKIFDETHLHNILVDFKPTSQTSGNYYNAILQNLFFATLNRPIHERTFAAKSTVGTSDGKEHYGIKTLFRDDNQKSWFRQSHDEVVKLFKEVPFLNGGLFECLDKDEEENNKIVYFDGFSRDERNKQGQLLRTFIPNRLFFDEEKGLISLLKRYNFTIEENTPNEVDVALDPELLGKVFENLLGAYNPETKETARKQSGSFYTPREIVNYMVDESLKAYLLSETVIAGLTRNPQDYQNYKTSVDKLFTNNPVNLEHLNKIMVQTIVQTLLKVKILDPACGSGAFPMGVLNRIIGIIEQLGLPNHIDPFQLKLHLIEKCIFGIDIQTIAVQISKLRFFISLIVEQTPNGDASDNYGIKSLPNLETNFVAANTLIGIKAKDTQGNLFEDPQIEVTKKSLHEIRHQHFSANTPKEKERCRAEDEKLRTQLAALLEANESFAPEDARQLAAWNPYNQNATSPFFDAEWMFGIAEGFDIVLGNPPYVQLQNNGGELANRYQNCGYQTFARSGDIYCLFYERGYQLLKPQGKLCYITSNKWMRAGYGENTRKFFAENTNPEQLIDFAGIKVFESATVDTNILMFSKDKNRQKTQACIVKKEGIKDLSVFIRQASSVCSFGAESWVVLSPIEQRIKAKIEAVGTPLKDWDINIYRGVLTGYNEAFIIDGNKKAELIAEDPKSAEIIRPILRGRDIKRYGYEFADLWLINTHNGIKEKDIKPVNVNDYPAVKNHLDKYFPALEKRQDKGDTPYNLRNCAYIEDFYNDKIIYPETTQGAYFAFDDGKTFIDKTCFMLISDKAKYIQAILSSKLFEYAYKTIFSSIELGSNGYQYNKHALLKLPVFLPDKKTEQQFIKLLEKKEYHKIDVITYSIFGLTEEEINCISISNKLSI